MGKSKDLNFEDLSAGSESSKEDEEYDIGDFNESKHLSFEVKLTGHSKLQRHSNNLFGKNNNINNFSSEQNLG